MAHIPFWGASHVVPGLVGFPPLPHPKLSYWTIHTLIIIIIIIISIFLIIKNQLNQRGYYPTPLNGKLAANPRSLPIMGLLINFGEAFSECEGCKLKTCCIIKH
jgi:hypothetical protein